MIKNDFINKLNYESAKTAIARKLGIKADELIIKASKSGDFKIYLNNVSGKTGSLLAGGRAILVTDQLNIREHKDNYSYEANIWLNLKNRSGEYKSKVGRIKLNNDKFVFYTAEDLKNSRKQKNNEDIVNENKAV